MRSQVALYTFVQTCPPEVQQRILNASVQSQEFWKATRRKLLKERTSRYRRKKQHRNTQNSSTQGDISRSDLPPVDRPLDPSLQANSDLADCSGHMASQSGQDINKFLDLPLPGELQDCHRHFLCATSKSSLAQGVCASSGRLLMECELSKVNYATLNNQHLLHPWKKHKAHILINHMLLESKHLDFAASAPHGWICDHCSTALKSNKWPAYSLANNIWTSHVPRALSILTIPEQLLIALFYPRAYIIKLHPRGGRGDHPDALQTALKATVTTYTANSNAVAKMLEGQLMPRTTNILPSLVAVTFIGQKKLCMSQLKSLFSVCGRVIYDALCELNVMDHRLLRVPALYAP